MKNKKMLGLLLIICVLFTVCGCNHKSDKSKTNNEKKTYIKAELNKKIVLKDIAEITINGVSIEEEILPPDTSGSVYKYKNIENEKYIVLKGTFKNLMSGKFRDFNNFNGVLKVNNKYEYKSFIIVFANDDVNTFYNEPDSLETMNCYIWVSVPDEIINDNSNTFDFYLDFFDNMNKKSINFKFKLKDIEDNEACNEFDYTGCISKLFDVDYDLINKNNIQENNYVKGVDLEHTQVVIRGTQEELDKVALVKAIIDLNRIEFSSAGTYDLEDIPIYAYDKNGNNLKTVMVIPQNISVSLHIGRQ